MPNQNQNAPISFRKEAKKSYKGSSNVRTVAKKKTRNFGLINAKSEISEGKATFELPIRTVSEANCFEPWRKKHERHKEQKRLVALSLNPHKGSFRLPARLLLTRFAPVSLDEFDNLPVSFKYIVDAICAILTGNYIAGRADGDKRISIACKQEKSELYGIRIEITWD